jgi:3-hydroxyisobutyrate dehydrogenase
MIAFYGMGLLGSNFVRALRRRGEEVRVWNRNRERAEPLTKEGAVVVGDPAEAARGARRIHLTLSDDAAVDDVLERVRPGLEPGVVIVDHTTTSPAGTRERAKRWADRGVEFQHAPVFMGPQNALESTGVMLASGDRARPGNSYISARNRSVARRSSFSVTSFSCSSLRASRTSSRSRRPSESLPRTRARSSSSSIRA